MKITRNPTGSVELPTFSTNVASAQKPTSSPVAEAGFELAGAYANLGFELADQYKKAEYNVKATEADLAISNMIIAEKKALETNPILPELGDEDDIITKKEKHWQEFSARVTDEIINKIGNGRLREDLTTSWNQRSTEIRGQVIEAAMDENISYMSNKQADNIQNLTLAGDFQGATTAAVRGVESGLFTREAGDSYLSYIDRSELLNSAEEQGLNYSDSTKLVNNSNLPLAEKGEAHKILKANEEERLRVEAEQLKETQEANLEEGFLGISTNNITTMPELDSMLMDGGRYEALGSVQSEKLRAALRRQMSDRDQGEPDPDDSAAIARIERAMDDPTIDAAGFKEVLANEGGNISAATSSKYWELSQKDIFPTKKDLLGDFIEDNIKVLGEAGVLGKDPEDMLNRETALRQTIRDLRYGDHLTAEQKTTGSAFTMDDAKKLFRNFQDETLIQILSNDALRENSGKFHWTDIESAVKQGLEGELFGRGDVSRLGNFLASDTMTTDQLQSQLAEQRGTSYDRLSKGEKKEVNTTVAIGQLVRAAESLFKTEYSGKDGVMGIDVKTNLPTVRTADNLYRLGLDGKEEKWEIWDDNIGGWVADPTVIIPNLIERPPVIRAWDELKKVLSDTNVTQEEDKDPYRVGNTILERGSGSSYIDQRYGTWK